MTDRPMQEYFDAHVAFFEGFTPEEEARVEPLLGAWDVRPGLRVLEPGCGSGRLTAFLSRAVEPTGTVLAFDVSGGMIRRALGRGLPRQVRFLQASADAVPAEDASFDLIVCFCVFPHFLEPARTLSELCRVLRPGGRLVIQHLEDREGMNAFHSGHAVGAPCLPLPPEDAMRALLAAAGFAEIHITDAPDGYRAGGRKPVRAI